VLEEHALHLERGHVDAAGLDHLLQPAAEAHAPVGVDQAQIAGVEVALPVEAAASRSGARSSPA
jgi:hypothetical protein